ncbi:hypothetical protein RIF29_16113 [Crotalaria pallida]|uniref:Uncharacterized protein n=1 Tax=Crotalaria pallida TaxID=3830 RepID=A0AAN9FEH9_CROPI
MKEANRISEAIVPSQPPYQHAPETDLQNPFQPSRMEAHGLQPPFIPSSSSQPCYAPFVHHIQETPISAMFTPRYGIDLNADFSAVASSNEEISQAALFEEIRRNPHRDARDRHRHCILSPPDDNDDG